MIDYTNDDEFVAVIYAGLRQVPADRRWVILELIEARLARIEGTATETQRAFAAYSDFVYDAFESGAARFVEDD